MNKTTKSYLIYAPASMTLQSLVERETKQNKTKKKTQKSKVGKKRNKFSRNVYTKEK